MNFLTTLNQLFEQASPRLRKVLLGLLLALVVPVAITATVLAWNDGLIQEKLGLMVTQDDLAEQTETINDYKIVGVDSVVNDAIGSYDLLMRQYLWEERKLAMDTAFIPLLRQIRTMTDAIIQLQRSARVTDARVQEIPAQFDDKLDRMLEASDPEATNDKLEELTRIVTQLQEENAAFREEMKSGRKTTKQRF